MNSMLNPIATAYVHDYAIKLVRLIFGFLEEKDPCNHIQVSFHVVIWLIDCLTNLDGVAKAQISQRVHEATKKYELNM